MIQSVRRAGAILRELGSGPKALGVTELSDRLGLAKATIYGLVRSLEVEELVERDTETGKYRLGPTLLQLGNAYLYGHELRARSLLWADRLAQRTSEAVRVGVPNGHNILIVHHVFRPDNSVQILEVGAAIPWHVSALGKAIAAYDEEETRRRLLDGPLPRLTGRTITDPEELAAVLEEVHRTGVALEDQEAVIGEAEVAAPVLDQHHRPVGAIGVAGPEERLFSDGVVRADVVGAVKESARGLSRDLGGGRRFARIR